MRAQKSHGQHPVQSVQSDRVLPGESGRLRWAPRVGSQRVWLTVSDCHGVSKNQAPVKASHIVAEKLGLSLHEELQDVPCFNSDSI